ncbi:hypothetical protein XI03_31270 [Bradyrhizobium sp. CCBAU 65884]|nr:hypothetical protein [Bradyrhizobium sp. CCBAU 65884]
MKDVASDGPPVVSIADLIRAAEGFAANEEKSNRESLLLSYWKIFFPRNQKLNIDKLTALLREIKAVLQDQIKTLSLKVTHNEGAKAIGGLTVKLQRLDRFEGWQTILPPTGAPAVQTGEENGTAKLSYATDNNDDGFPVIRDPKMPVFRWQVEDPRDGTILVQSDASLLDKLATAVAFETWQYADKTDYDLAAAFYDVHAEKIEAADDPDQIIEAAAPNDPVGKSRLIAMYWTRRLAKDALNTARALPVFPSAADKRPDEKTLKQYFYGLLRSDALLHASYTGPFGPAETTTAKSNSDDLLNRASLIDAGVIVGLLRPRITGSDGVPLVPVLVRASAQELETTRMAFTDAFRDAAAKKIGSGLPGVLDNDSDHKAYPPELEALIKALSSDQPGGVWAVIKRFAQARPSANALVAGDREPDGEAPGWVMLKALGCLSNQDIAGLVGPEMAQEAEQAKRRLALMSREGLEQLGAGLLNADAGALAVGRRKTAVNIMRRVLAEQFPVEVYLSDWEEYHRGNSKPVGNSSTAAFAAKVLEKVAGQPSEPIRAQQVREISETVKSELALDGPASEKLDQEVATHLSLARLTLNFELGKKLVTFGLRNASDIVAFGEHRLLDEVTGKDGPAGVSVTDVQNTFARARSIHLAKNMLVGELVALKQGITLPAVRGFSIVPGDDAFDPVTGWANRASGNAPTPTDLTPDLRRLFKLADSCECRPCESIHGAGAYLTDVLEFLKHRAIVPVKGCLEGHHTTITNARDLLFERLPGLKYIDLTCANAETPLPYIDLICEALEDAVACLEGMPGVPVDVHWHGKIADGDAISAGLLGKLKEKSIPITSQAHFSKMPCGEDGPCETFFLRDTHAVLCFRRGCGCNDNWSVWLLRQTTLTEAELAAEPEYVQPAAYEATRSAYSGYALPFDLGDVSIAALLELVGSSRRDLRRAAAFRPKPDLASAADILAIDPVVAGVIVGKRDTEERDEFWKHAGKPLVVNDKVTVDSFLRHCELSYAELERLTRTAYLGEHCGLRIERHHDCDLQKQNVVWEPRCKCHRGDQHDDVLPRTSRFLRLWKQLGWTIEQVDRAISAARLGNGELDDKFLIALSAAFRLRNRLGLSIDDTIVLFGRIPLTAERPEQPSMYWRLFLDPRVNGFGGKDDQTLLEKLYPEDVEKKGDRLDDPQIESILTVCFGLNKTEYELILTEAIKPRGELELSFDNLARIRSTIVLRRALQLPWHDYFSLLRLFNQQDEFASPAATLQLVALLGEPGEARRFTPSQLRYFLLGDVQKGDPANIGEMQIKKDAYCKFLVKLQKDLRDVATLPIDDSKRQDAIGGRLKSGLLPSAMVWAGIDRLAVAVESDRAAAVAGGKQTTLPTQDQLADSRAKTTQYLDFDNSNPPADGQKWLEQAKSICRSAFSPLLAWAGCSSEAIDKAIDNLSQRLSEIMGGKASLLDQQISIVDYFLSPLDRKAAAIERAAILEADTAAFIASDAGRSSILLDTLHVDKATVRAILMSLLELAPEKMPNTPDQVTDILHGTNADGLSLREALTRLWRAGLKLWKAVQFLRRLDMEDATITWLAQPQSTGQPPRSEILDWLTIEALPSTKSDLGEVVIESGDLAKKMVQEWRRLLTGLAFLRDYPPVTIADSADKNISFRDVLDSAIAVATFVVRDGSSVPKEKALDLASGLSRLTGWPLEHLTALLAAQASQDGATWPPPTLSPGRTALIESSYYRHLDTAVKTLRKTGLALDEVAALLDANQPSKPSQQRAAQLRKLIKKRFDDSAWQSAVKAGQDRIRARKRDALVAYLVGSRFDSADDIFAYYLIDPEMGACMQSSRIVQAHGAVQLFVQRCLMGLEQEVKIPPRQAYDWDAWKWMKYFRVWEAARKIFLYPEDWIEPELRDDKSQFFRELEDEINQNDMTAGNLEDAVVNYLQKLREVARLAVCAAYYEFDERIPILHVLARTPGEPHKYFYRRWVAERYWTPWESVDLEISGDHQLLYVNNGRLHLAWATFKQLEVKPDLGKNLPDRPGAPYPAPPNPPTQWEIKLATSQYADGRWLGKQVTPLGIRYPRDAIEKLDEGYPVSRFRLAFHDTPFPEVQVSFVPLLSDDPVPIFEQIIGSFVLSSCSGYPQPQRFVEDEQYRSFPQFLRSDVTTQTSTEVGVDPESDRLIIVEGPGASSYAQVLERTPGSFVTAVPRQASNIDLALGILRTIRSPANTAGRTFSMGGVLPFFYSDRSVAAVFRLKLPEVKKSPTTAAKFARAFARLADFLGEPLQRERLGQIISRPDRNQHKGEKEKALQALWDDLHEPDLPGGTPVLQEIVDLITLLDNAGQYRKRYEPASRFYHPPGCDLVQLVFARGVDRLYERSVQCAPVRQSGVPAPEFSIKDFEGPPWQDAVSFDLSDAYSSYNWETFFHIPFLIAVRLAQQGNYEDSLRWFHYIFDPAGVASISKDCDQSDRPGEPLSESSIYWITKPFYQTSNTTYEWERIEALLDPNKWSQATDHDLAELAKSIMDWRDKPGVPFVVARHRWVAFQKAVVYRYIETLLDWGDAKFRLFQRETIVEATQLYVLASKLLGPRPRGDVPREKWTPGPPPRDEAPFEKWTPENYAQLSPCINYYDQWLYVFLSEVEPLSSVSSAGEGAPHLNFFSGYFCVPQNEKLLKLWDRVEDRLYKIRHCQDIDGVERVLALFSPPIDPGMLVRAAAAGLSVEQLLTSLSGPPPHYRFTFLHQKATEFTQEVRTLGNELLQVMEKRDAEALSTLRSNLELKLLRAASDVRKYQLDEATRQLEAIDKNIDTVTARAEWYRSRQVVSGKEQNALDLTQAALVFRVASQALQAFAGGAHLIPQVTFGASGFGGSPHVVMQFGGNEIASSSSAFSAAVTALSDIAQTQAGVTATLAGYERRKDDWDFQASLADRELQQLAKQRAAAEIRVSIAERELRNHELQIDNAEKIDEALRAKFTNRELYDWMIRQVSAVYYRTYQLALDFAMKAEQCLQRELPASPAVTYVQPGYWDSLRKGLLAANGLLLDLKRMEAGYIERNARGPELTKHASLATLDPMQLAKLRTSGKCQIAIPEELFDLDHPGQYRRRIKTVGLSLPCLAGPYTTISCRLKLVRSQIRNVESREGDDADHLVEDTVPVTQIATSSGQNDSGLFELNLRDERYLPFEGAGAISWWELDLPGTDDDKGEDIRQFDYESISDAVLHLRYTAVSCADKTRKDVIGKLSGKLKSMTLAANQSGVWTMVSLRNDLPDLFYKLSTTGKCDLQLPSNILPLLQQKLGAPTEVLVGVSAKDGLAGLKVGSQSLVSQGSLGRIPIGNVTLDLLTKLVPFDWTGSTAPLDIMIFVGTKGNNVGLRSA